MDTLWAQFMAMPSARLDGETILARGYSLLRFQALQEVVDGAFGKRRRDDSMIQLSLADGPIRSLFGLREVMSKTKVPS